MSEGHFGGHAESESVGSSRGSTWQERRQKRREDREREMVEEQFGLGEGRIKHFKQYWVPRGMTNTRKETKRLSGYASW